MTAEEKQLLLIDLSARLSYGVMVVDISLLPTRIRTYKLMGIDMLNGEYVDIGDFYHSSRSIANIRPYLRPMSSMTDDEKKEIEEILEHSFHVTDKGNIVSNDWRDGAVFTSQYDAFKIMDFCNKHHLDCRELIPMGLALEAPEGMYN